MLKYNRHNKQKDSYITCVGKESKEKVYTAKFVLSILMIIMLWIVAFMSIYHLIKQPGNKKLKNKYNSEENIRKEKAQLKKFLKVYVAAIVILIILLLLVLYMYFI